MLHQKRTTNTFWEYLKKVKPLVFNIFFQTSSFADSSACGALPILLEQRRGAFWRDYMYS